MAADSDERSDEELMRAYVGGDEAAFRMLFERYAPRLMGMARRHLRNETEAREVVQQTFFQLHAARNDFREGSKLRPWVVTITMNLIRQYYRKKGRRKEAPIEAAIHTVGKEDARPIEQRQRRERIREALAALPQSQREVVELHWFQDKPFAEVAEIVGAREGAVRVRAHRAYQKLRELLAGELEG